MNRRDFLGGMALAGLTGCVRAPQKAAVPPPLEVLPKLMPVRAQVDRIFRVTVCLRPFRAAGPRLEVERVGDKTVVHNYGHGGSGWSLSWGSSSIAVEKAMALGEKGVAVIGCGALGLTSAILLQRAGAKVTIYAKRGIGLPTSDLLAPPDHGRRDSRDRLDQRRVARFSGALGKDVPQFVSHVRELSRHGRYSRGVYRSLTIACGTTTAESTLTGAARRDGLEFARYQDRVPDHYAARLA